MKRQKKLLFKVLALFFLFASSAYSLDNARMNSSDMAVGDKVTDNVNNTVSYQDSISSEYKNLTGAWLQCVIFNGEVRPVQGSMKVFRSDGTFSIYMSSTGKEWTNGIIDSLTSNSYIEKVANQTSSIFAGESVPIRYSIEKTGEYLVLKSEYYMNKDAAGNPVYRWMQEYYVKISDTEAEKIINRNKNQWACINEVDPFLQHIILSYLCGTDTVIQ